MDPVKYKDPGPTKKKIQVQQKKRSRSNEKKDPGPTKKKIQVQQKKDPGPTKKKIQVQREKRSESKEIGGSKIQPTMNNRAVAAKPLVK